MWTVCDVFAREQAFGRTSRQSPGNGFGGCLFFSAYVGLAKRNNHLSHARTKHAAPHRIIDAARKSMKPNPLTPTLSRLRERVRTGHDEVKTSSCRINNDGGIR